ncbi:MAG: class II fumarate hydratase [Planctomycetota bacterium]
MNDTRIERDTMGEMRVPADALYGASTQRAVLNFPISGYRFGRPFLRALGLIKYAAAAVNEQLGRLKPELAGAIRDAAREVADGRHDEHFVVDVFQTGSGTSTNMNANEVIATRAGQLLGTAGDERRVHPNDHVNLGQSSNDVIPTAMHVALTLMLRDGLRPALSRLQESLRHKAREFDDIIKIGRTHLMDATPIRLGQEFSGYARQVAQADARLAVAGDELRELPIGGTAVGTGINTHPEFAGRVCAVLAHEVGVEFQEATDHFAAQHAKDAVVAFSGALRGLAVTLTKIANDIRWLGSGPRCGLGELRLPATQPGSSIMPGKVNPVIPEAVLQVCAQVMGHDAAVTSAAALLGNLDLHTGMPVMTHNLLEAVRLLTNVCGVFVERCLDGLAADRERCETLVEQSLAMCTSLVPLIGYDRAAELAKEAHRTGRTIRELALEKKLADPARLAAALDAAAMTRPQTDQW